MNIKEIKEMIYNAAVDGHLGDFEDVQVWLKTMSKLDKEILLLVYNEGWNKAMDEVDEDLSPWESDNAIHN